MLGHELRNPSRPSAPPALDRLRAERDAVRAGAEVVERQVEHLARLVDDLLDVSRLTRGKIELRKEPIELAEVIAEAIEATRALDRRRHAGLRGSSRTRLWSTPTRPASRRSRNLLDERGEVHTAGGAHR